MKKSQKISITLLSLIGLALAIELCVVYYNANFAQDAAPSICAINEAMDCDGVAKSIYSQFLGIPLSLWGVCLYLFVLFMTFVDKIKNIKFLGFLNVFKNPLAYIFCISLLSFIISMCLGYISVKRIDSICIFCFMTYVIDLIIALIAKDWSKNIFYEIKTSISDFIEAIKVKRYAFWFILIVLLGCAVLSYTTVSNILTPQIKTRNDLVKIIKEYKNMTNLNTLGPQDANVEIKEFIDFNCGGCLMANIYLHEIVREFKNVKVTQFNVPLEKICNPNMQFDGHKNSCLKARYALAAKKQNQYWPMADLLFYANIENENELIDKSRLLDLDIKKLKEDARSEEIEKEIQDSIKFADENDVVGTPTLYIGMQKIVGAPSYLDLKNIVIQHGGIEKETNYVQ